MSEKQFVVVAYDITNDRRRTRLHKRLLDFGTPVQYSIFECLLEGKDVDRMKAVVRKTVRQKQDHVRYYQICKACQEKIEVLGHFEVVSEKEVLVV